MGNKDFHPSSISNLKKVSHLDKCISYITSHDETYLLDNQVWEAKEKLKMDEKRQEELRLQYLKEQEQYQSKYKRNCMCICS